MKAVLPGKPEPRLQALATGAWDGRRVTAYVSGNALAILGSHDTLRQTIYDDDDTSLEAVALDEVSGSLAVCTDRVVRVYQPIEQPDGALQWTLQCSFEPAVRGDDISPGSSSSSLPMTLSWGGSARELLVGHTSLALYQIGPEPVCAWRKTLASPVKWATLSYDAGYIACAGYTERLVKVWRRLNFDVDNACFDFFYLPHAAPVVGLEWRQPYHAGHTVEHVLYTFGADGLLRIWTTTEPTHPHGSGPLQPLALWGTVDLTAALLSSVSSPTVWATILQGRDLSAATERAVHERDQAKESNADTGALQHLVAIANRSSEVCLVLDARGALTALSLENLDSQAQKRDDVYTIVQLASPDLDFSLPSGSGLTPAHVQMHTFCDRDKGHLNLLVHDVVAGKIDVYEANVARLFDDHRSPAEKLPPRLWRRATWAGHSGPISKIVRNFSGSAIVSRTDHGEAMLWGHVAGPTAPGAAPLPPPPPLCPKMALPETGAIRRICLLRKGRYVVLLLSDRLAVWDCRHSAPTLLGSCDYTVAGEPLCLLVLPREKAADGSVAHLATVTSEKEGVVWKIVLPALETNGHSSNGHEPSLREFCRFQLEDAGDLAYMLPVDPAGASPFIAGFLDVFARDMAISYTTGGRVAFWTARVDHAQSKVEWLSTSAMETGVQRPALVSGSTRKKAALVNAQRSAVSIWDIQGARLEYDGAFASHDTVQDLDWTSTPDAQSILAVGFPHRVLLLAQLRFDYLNKGPAWAVVREIQTRASTPHPIGDSTWLRGGDLVVGAGHQLFVYGRRYSVPGELLASTSLRPTTSTKETKADLFDVVQRLNGPLPVFHPQFLSQCMLSGKSRLVQRILLALHQTLKYWLPGEPVDDYLGLPMEAFYTDSGRDSGSASHGNTKPADRETGMAFFSRADGADGDGDDGDDNDETFTETTAQLINEKLTTVALPQLSGHEQIQLADIVECTGFVERQRRSMDENAARYMLFYRQHALRKGRTSEIHMGWREINWAFHSTSQDILTDFVARQHHGAPLWKDARESGLFMWLGEVQAVKSQFEIIARNEYAHSEDKNPVDCSLFYLALRKKTVLQGLWRMASGNREQAATQRLLAHNFDEPKWRTAALKNAYALMSKRRFAYAAAFFLLADHLQDAVGVCFGQLHDLQLAVAVARVYEGDDGPVLRRFLEEEVLAAAAQEGNRWMASWAFWMLRRRDMAVRALITPVYTLLETPAAPADLKSRLFLTDDPALVILYAQLRQKTLQTLRGASKVTPRVEWELVLHSARLYGRMGCDLLGLDLVRNWEFLRTPTPASDRDAADPFQRLARRNSLVVADLPDRGLAGQLPADLDGGASSAAAAAAAAAKRAPTVFEEPDANALLDSFGF